MINLRERLEIKHQPKHQMDVRTLLDEMNGSPFIGDISAVEIDRLIRAHSVLFFYDGEVLVGLAGWDAFDGAWIELGPFYTAEVHRGQGVGSFMFDTVEQVHSHTIHNLYGVTKNPMVKHMFAKHHFHQVRIWTLPREVQIHLLRKLSLRRLLRYLRKLRFGDSVNHFIKIQV
jgi:GNAT superfamily N-acetyltransferase